LDTRVRGPLTRRLVRFAREKITPEELLDPKEVPLRHEGGPWVAPDCANCKDRCCVHRDVGSGILLSLADVAALVDSGLEHAIVGRFTFRRNKKGKPLREIDEMPRLAKRQGNCMFYDPESGLCGAYGTRPTICRRFPFEVDYGKNGRKPFARFIPWSPCVRKEGEENEASIRQMAHDAVVDENVSFEDAVLLPAHHEELRAIGFERYLPPPEECP
jgi:Fe-S-cluster containining protein